MTKTFKPLHLKERISISPRPDGSDKDHLWQKLSHPPRTALLYVVSSIVIGPLIASLATTWFGSPNPDDDYCAAFDAPVNHAVINKFHHAAAFQIITSSLMLLLGSWLVYRYVRYLVNHRRAEQQYLVNGLVFLLLLLVFAGYSLLITSAGKAC